ncbi:MAG TPA: helix-turn-helix domain-containing protein [Ignavibacteriaceae bacterium]|nr:helix-turn-helix domain-containing protein [Ignavibacteriaceae bacterium]
MLDKFAEELHEAREKSGLTLQQMALKTRIDIKFLDAIDKGDFAFLADPYVKAFIKDFAKCVGLDENKIIQKYEAAKKGKQLEEKVENEQEIPEKKKPHKKVQTYDATPPQSSSDSGSNLKKNIVVNGLVIGGGILVIFILYLLFIKDSDEIVIAEKPIEEVIGDNQVRFEEPAQNLVDNSQPSDSMILTVLSSDTSWVQIIFDDKNKEEFTLFPNSQKSIKAENNFKISLGNSGAIKFQMNNKPLNFSGTAGSLSYIQITREGLSYLKNPPSLEANE